MTDSRFALYLIPPYDISRGVAEVHTMLRKQFGFAAADRFPVHCTVKGFFLKNRKPLELLWTDLDEYFRTQSPLIVRAEDQRVDSIGFGLSLLTLDGKPNRPFLELREELVDLIRPFLSADCDFKEHDLGRPYHPHITFAFRDIPGELYESVFAWLESGPDFSQPFLAKQYHFYEFTSDAWQGNWWETLRWRLLRTWHLDG